MQKFNFGTETNAQKAYDACFRYYCDKPTIGRMLLYLNVEILYRRVLGEIP